MEPGSKLLLDGIKGMIFPDEEVATAWWYYTTDQLSKMAGILGKSEDAIKYQNLAAKIKAAYQKEFIRHGKVVSKRMCRYVRPLYMGKLEGDRRQRCST